MRPAPDASVSDERLQVRAAATPLQTSTADESRRIAAAQKGDVAAFNELVVAYQELAYNVALRLVGDAETAADVTQDAFVSAFRNLGQFKGGSFRSWLLRIVTNGSYDVLRARRRHDDASLDDLMDETGFDAPDPGDLPETLVLRREQLVGLQAALQVVPLPQRTVLVLFDVHGLAYEEIATILNLNLGTVKSRLSRARSRLRDHLLAHPELWKA
jgi:RNA polymerase sigma-70 factor (ECF subfamily)